MPFEESKSAILCKSDHFAGGPYCFICNNVYWKSIIIPISFRSNYCHCAPSCRKFSGAAKNKQGVSHYTYNVAYLLVIAAFGTILISQASRFGESWPALVEKFTSILNQNIVDAADYFNKDPQKIHDWITKTQGEIINVSTAAIGQTIVLLGNGLVILLLVPFYIFMILFYQPLLIEFVRMLSGENYQTQVKEIVSQIKTVIQRYLVGLVYRGCSHGSNEYCSTFIAWD